MRNRKVQRALRKMKEEKISLRNESYAVDIFHSEASVFNLFSQGFRYFRYNEGAFSKPKRDFKGLETT